MGVFSAFRRRHFLTPAERDQIAAELAGAERYTRAKIGLTIEELAAADPVDRAEALFRQWDLSQAERSVAVLVYVSAVSRNFAVVGGEEVCRLAPRAFWEILHRDLRHHFEERRYCDGIFKALAQVAVQLQHHFPPDGGTEPGAHPGDPGGPAANPETTSPIA
ncbi:MAG TPA: TPM domain-containing protein [Candidatus Methylomirabilis sp.]|nr:TPM domain-containing protein [Candidatus Methylomirabilis sp.]HSB81285.1 TPM domain-containing protein [Candidatus Methylomirabilis sp.]